MNHVTKLTADFAVHSEDNGDANWNMERGLKAELSGYVEDITNDLTYAEDTVWVRAMMARAMSEVNWLEVEAAVEQARKDRKPAF